MGPTGWWEPCSFLFRLKRRMLGAKQFTGQRVLSASRASKACVRPAGRARMTTVCKLHKICVLPGDGIGPEIMKVAQKVLTAAGKKEGDEFEYHEELIGGAAIDATGVPLPEKTLTTAKACDAVLLSAIGGQVFWVLSLGWNEGRNQS